MRNSKVNLKTLEPYLWIAAGSALGGCARFAMGSAIMAAFGSANGFPWGTFAVNIAGCLAIGLFATSIDSLPWRQFLMIGLCGGFTTFSSFGLETLNLIRTGHAPTAAAYVAGSITLCLGAVWAGHALATAGRP